MKIGRRVIGYIICIALGAVLFGLGVGEIVDEYWCGMGSGLVFVGVLRLIQLYRISKNDDYREKIKIENSDERNRFVTCVKLCRLFYSCCLLDILFYNQ